MSGVKKKKRREEKKFKNFYFKMELNKIYNESNIETMAKMPDNFIDLTVTSPPYDGLRTYNGYSFPFEDIAKELFRVTKDGGVVVWVVGDATVNGCESLTSFKQALYFKEIGFNVHDTMIYAKENPPPLNHNRYEQAFEYMFVFSKGKPKTVNLLTEKSLNAGKVNNGTMRNNGSDELSKKHGAGKLVLETRIKRNIFYYGVGTEQDSKGIHPAIFPEKLAADHIYTWSKEGDLVYDCFMGSGTTAKMAHLQKRNWIGSEMSKEYVDLANKRIKPYLDQISLF